MKAFTTPEGRTGALPETIRKKSIGIFMRLPEAEGKVTICHRKR